MRAVAYLAVVAYAVSHNRIRTNAAARAWAWAFFFIFLGLDVWSVSHGGW